MNTILPRFMCLMLATWILPASAANISVGSKTYRFSGDFRFFRVQGESPQFRNGLGRGYYRFGYVKGRFTNNSFVRSGPVVGNLWISSFIGSSSGRVIFSAGWGGNRNFVFNANESWTSTRYGYRKRINRFGYASLAAHEYVRSSGTWRIRDEEYFSGSFQLW